MKEQEMLEKEIEFINLFGYKVQGPDNSNRYLVVDKKGKSVGFIQRKKLHKKNVKKDKPAVYGYVIKIDSQKFKYGKTINLSREYDVNYSFDIISGKLGENHIELTMSDWSSMTIWGGKFGFISLKISSTQFFVDFRSELENYKVNEVILIRDLNYDTEYGYDISYRKKEELDPNKYNTLNLIIYQRYDGDLEVRQKYWNNHVLKRQFISRISSTIGEVVDKQELGTNALYHLKYILSQIIPTEENILDILVSKADIEKEGIVYKFLTKEMEEVKTLKK